MYNETEYLSSNDYDEEILDCEYDDDEIDMLFPVRTTEEIIDEEMKGKFI